MPNMRAGISRGPDLGSGDGRRAAVGIGGFFDGLHARPGGLPDDSGFGDEEAVAGVDQARALRLRSGSELLISPHRSLRTLAHARAIDGSMEIPADRREHLVRETLSRYTTLAPVSRREIEAVLKLGLTEGQHRASPFERRLFAPWLIVIGETSPAREWADLDQIRSDFEAPRWMSLQADLIEQQLRVAEGRLPSTGPESSRSEGESTSPAAWSRAHIDFYWHLIEGNTSAGYRWLEAIEALRPSLPEALRGDGTVLGALCAAVDGAGAARVPLPAPELSLFRLGSVLIAGEAVALGGSREDAASWYEWFGDHWPVHVLRGLTWPVLAQRVRGLLGCRAGDLDAGIRWMADAIAVADRIGSPVEAALARVQLAELLAFDPQRESRERWIELVDDGTARCRTLGIPYEHHAYRARTAVARGRFDLISSETASLAAMTSPLTVREVEVLRLFRAGHSYRQAAEILGVGWRTVQSHAYNAYQKLGVSSKIAAVTAAARLQVL